jgi:uncharacterized membrane protein
MRNFLVIVCIALPTLFFISGSALADITLDSSEYYFDLAQGETVEKEVTIHNDGSEYIEGIIEVQRLECAWTCPKGDLSVHEIKLNPGESIRANLTISSSILNRVQEITLPIILYLNKSHSFNFTTIAEIHINVHSNLIFYGGIIILAIALIILGVVYLIKGRFRFEK